MRLRTRMRREASRRSVWAVQFRSPRSQIKHSNAEWVDVNVGRCDPHGLPHCAHPPCPAALRERAARKAEIEPGPVRIAVRFICKQDARAVLRRGVSLTGQNQTTLWLRRLLLDFVFTAAKGTSPTYHVSHIQKRHRRLSPANCRSSTPSRRTCSPMSHRLTPARPAGIPAKRAAVPVDTAL
jgi:hypothetical protein